MQNPRYPIIITLGIVVAFVFFATLTNEGQPQNLPIGVVDMDGSYLSRRLCHEINATQGIHVHAVYNSHGEARQAMQRGEIFAFYEIPHGTYNNVLQFRAPHFGLYSNPVYLLAGTLSYKQLATMGMLATGAVQREVLRKKGYTEDQIMGLIMPVEFDNHLVGNPWANYGIYLMTTLIPAIISFIALLHSIYLIGRERQQRSTRSWMKKAGGNAVKAFAGKLLPYFLWYTLLLLISNLIMFGPMHFPLHGSWLYMVLASILLILGVMSIGALNAGCIPDAPLSMGIGAVYGAMCFSLSGFSFPIEAMPRIFTGISQAYPIRHYYRIYSNVAIFGNGMSHLWPNLVALCAFGLLFLLGAYMFSRNYMLEPRSADNPKTERSFQQ